MEQKQNYQLELEKLIQKEKLSEVCPTDRKTLLLHSCCAPCSSYCMEYLRQFFQITILYYNPNITNAPEYEKRVFEQKRLIAQYNEMDTNDAGVPLSKIHFMEGRYEPGEFFQIAKGLEEVREGGERCFRCYRLRLLEAALIAKREGYDYFTTTLTISPLKNAQKLNEIGHELEREIGVPFLPSDFKKKNGYKRSIELSEQYGLYRQDYCGCAYSKAEREKKK